MAKQKIEAKNFNSISSLKGDLLSPQTNKGRVFPTPMAVELRDEDAFLQSIDSVLTFLALNFAKQQAFVDRVLNGPGIPKGGNFGLYGPTQAEQALFAKKLEGVLASDAAQPSQPLKEFRKAAELLTVLNTKEIQAKYESAQRAAEQSLATELPGLPRTSQPSAPGRQGNQPAPAPTDQAASEVVQDSAAAWQALAKLSAHLKSRSLKEAEFISLQKLVGEVGNFHRHFQSAIEVSRDKLLVLSPPEFLKLDFEPDLKNFEKSLERIRARNADFEHFAFTKLSELREQNMQLVIVQNHING